MGKIILLQGAPCSGKATWAKQYAEETAGVEIVNKDTLRVRYGKGKFTFEHEAEVEADEVSIVKNTISSGKTIIIDDTNLNQKYLDLWNNVAKELGCEIELKTFYVPFEEAMKRSKARKAAGGLYISRDVMMGFYKRYFPDRLKDEFTDHRVIKDPQPALNPAVICDLDATLALHQGREPFDWDKVQTDLIDPRLRDVLKKYVVSGVTILFVSGRPEKSRLATTAWLDEHLGCDYQLFLRRDDDFSHGDDQKREVYRTNIKDKYNVLCVFEDSNKCVNMYRKEGLLVCQVENNDY